MEDCKNCKAKIYFAGPDVFSPNWEEHKRSISSKCRERGFQPVFPSDSEGWVSRRIVEENIDRIKRADAIIANMSAFRGVEPDSGTCFEIGIAKAFGKPIVSVMATPETMVDRVNASAWGPATKFESGWEWRDKDGNGIESFGFPLNIMISETTKFATSYDEAFDWISGAFGVRGARREEMSCEGMMEFGTPEFISSEFIDYVAEREPSRFVAGVLSRNAPKIFAATCALRDIEEIRRDRATFAWAAQMGWESDGVFQWGMRNLVKRVDLPLGVRDGVWEVFSEKEFPPSMRTFAEWWDRELLPDFVVPFIWGPSERLLFGETEEEKRRFIETYPCIEYRDSPEDSDMFSVVMNGRKYVPKFQLDDSGKVSKTFQMVIELLGRRISDWRKAMWLVAGNARLGGAAPFESITDIPEAVLSAAAKEMEAGFKR